MQSVAYDGADTVNYTVQPKRNFQMTDLKVHADSCIVARHCGKVCMAAQSNLDEERHTNMFHDFEPLLYSAHQCCCNVPKV